MLEQKNYFVLVTSTKDGDLNPMIEGSTFDELQKGDLFALKLVDVGTTDDHRQQIGFRLQKIKPTFNSKIHRV